MTKLSDTQPILLSNAAGRETFSILPLPATVSKAGAPKAMAALTARGYAEERETNEISAVHRSDGDRRYGLFATSAGLAASGVSDGPDADAPAAPSSTPDPSAAQPRPRPLQCSHCFAARVVRPPPS